MNDERLMPWEHDGHELLRIICQELHHTATRIQFVHLLAHAEDEGIVFACSCRYGRVTLAGGRFTIEQRVPRRDGGRPSP